MANEAFALSPMSARAAEPNEADYDAIREAFMETARGRWFLGEYAKRNRNADTSMVLDAVARIEETLAAQRQPVVEDRLPEALIEIRRAVREAETIAITAVDPATLEASLGPIQRGVRIIKEISWRWREIGADGRICDLIDSQLAAIEAACGQISTIDPRTELKAAFDLLRDRIELTETSEAVTAQAEAAASPAPATAEEASAAEGAFGAAETPAVEVSASEAGLAEAMDVAETIERAAEPERVEAATDDVAREAEVADELALDAAAEAEDEAVLDMVAFEMAAPDPEFDEVLAEEAGIAEPVAAEIETPVISEPVAPAEPIEPIAAEPIAAMAAAIATADVAVATLERPIAEAVHVSPLPMPSPVPVQPSLGATILASGILQKPRAAANDPLAPIRRMTQAEKIAFFS